jgi:hypothetical protein
LTSGKEITLKTKPAKYESKLAENLDKTPIPVPANPSAPSPIEEKVNRLSIPLTADGQIDYDSMREKTRQKVKDLIGGPRDASPKPIVEVFDPAWTNALLDTLGKVESFAAVQVLKMTPEIAEKAFSYNEMEKAKIGVPLAKVINKYAPVWMEQYKDEIALAMLFVTITAVKYQMATMLMAASKAKPAQSAAPTIPLDAEVVTSETLKN